MTTTPAGAAGFLARHKKAVTGDPECPLLFLANFDVEERWALGERGLPRQFASAAAVASRMDEFALCLAGPTDHVLLKTAPDPDYLSWLAAIGVELPTTHALEGESAIDTALTELALGSEPAVAALRALARRGVRLAPHGVSDSEERLAAAAGMPLAAPAAHICKTVNSKVYSRQLADKLGVRQPPGRSCVNAEELDDALAWGREALGKGRPIVVKDAFGAAGRGSLVVTPDDGVGRLDRVFAIVARSLRGSADQRLGLVVEEWVPKHLDLNCQVTITRDGATRVDFVKEMIIDKTAMRGHRIPARLSQGQSEELFSAVDALARQLAIDGYYGSVGFDAMTGRDGEVYPVVEINARNNMSTYQASLHGRFLRDDEHAVARWYPLRLTRQLPFAQLRRHIADALYDPARRSGLIVNNFATVNADAARLFDGAASVTGRLYGLVIGPTPGAVADIDTTIQARLANLLPAEDNE